MALLKVSLLGPPQLTRAGCPTTAPLSQKSIGLLAYLMMGPSQGYPRDRLASLFWGETGDEHASYNLRRAIWSLRKSINPPEGPLDLYVRYEDGHYAFNHASPYWLDVEVFEEAINRFSHGHLPPALHLSPGSGSLTGDPNSTLTLEETLRLYRGEFLQGCNPHGCAGFMDWLFLRRDRLEQTYIEGLRTLAARHVNEGDCQQAVAYYQQILNLDPVNEAVCRDLMLIYHLIGKRDAALQQYHTFKRALRQQFDIDPLPETEQLYLDIRDGPMAVESRSHRLTSPSYITPASVSVEAFVGRETEQQDLMQAFKLAMTGRGRVVVVTGEAGIGKTRLIVEFLRHISQFPVHILQAQCYEHEQGLPYQPIIDALRAFFPVADFGHIAKLSDLWLAEVAKLLPEIHDYLSRRPVSPALYPDQERNRLFEGFAQFLAHLSQCRTLILFLDDFHAADKSTFDLVHYLARRLASARVLILCAVQSEILPIRPELGNLLNQLDRTDRLVTIPLRCLSETEVIELIRQIIEAPVESEKLGRRLHLKTGGNPFFVVEMLKARQEKRGDSAYETPLPSSVFGFIQRRLTQLDRRSQQVLQAAAVVGRQFDSTTLQRLYSGDEQDFLSILDQLVVQRWFTERSDIAPGKYEFSHGLVQEAIYETLRADWRLRLHRRVGLALEETGSDRDEHAGRLAYHFWMARDGEKALRYSLKAAYRARKLYANREAIDHYRRAVEIAKNGALDLPADHLLDIHCQLGQVCELLGKYDEAIVVYNHALSSADLSEPLHRRLYLQLAAAHTRKGAYDRALEYLQTINAHLAESKDPSRKLEAIQVARGLAQVYLHREQSHKALAFCTQALTRLEDHDLDSESAALVEGFSSERVAVNEIMGDSYFHLGNYERAVSHYDHALTIAQQRDQRAAIPRLHRRLSRVSRRWGNYAEAEVHARQSLAICRQTGDVAGEAASLGALGDIAYNRGDFEQTIDCYGQALETFLQLGDQHRIADYYLSLAFVKLDQEEVDEANAYLQKALAIGQAISARLVLVRAEYHLAKVARTRGDLTEAQSRAERAIEIAHQAGIRLLEAMGLRLLGEILSQRQQPAQAEICMIESLRLIEGLGDQFEVAWTLRSYARLLASRQDMPHAQAQLERAIAIFARLGAKRELANTRRDLARLQGIPRPS